MKKLNSPRSRREFLAGVGTVIVATSPLLMMGQTQAADMPKVDEADPTAKGLGYLHDASKVDAAKYPNKKEGQNCANCILYTGKDGEAWGPCGIFPGKAVAAKGWCSAWAKKA